MSLSRQRPALLVPVSPAARRCQAQSMCSVKLLPNKQRGKRAIVSAFAPSNTLELTISPLFLTLTWGIYTHPCPRGEQDFAGVQWAITSQGTQPQACFALLSAPPAVCDPRSRVPTSFTLCLPQHRAGVREQCLVSRMGIQLKYPRPLLTTRKF